VTLYIVLYDNDSMLPEFIQCNLLFSNPHLLNGWEMDVPNLFSLLHGECDLNFKSYFISNKPSFKVCILYLACSIRI
jgi:hypothetical protein